MPLARHTRAAVVVAVITSSLVTAGHQASADQVEATCAAPAAQGPTLRYLILFDRGTPASAAASEITGACGSTTVFYPQIAVAVATSTSRGFAERIGLDRAFSAQSARLGKNSPNRDETTSLTPAHAPAGTAVVAAADRTGEQWDMAMIRATEAHTISKGSRDVVVGVLDSGVDAAHPELSPAMASEESAGCVTGKPDTRPQAWAPTSSTHGTHVAGIIAASDDGRGITGVAPGVRVASVKVVDDDGHIYPEYAVCGFMWAAERGMKVTNSSYFVDPWLFTCSYGPQQVVRETLRRAVEYAGSRGVVNVAAATNEGIDMADPPQPGCRVLPAGLRGVVAVSSVGPDLVKAGYSAYGLGTIDVTAPGGDRKGRGAQADEDCVLSTVPGGYQHRCGTSMAAPHVSGVAALLASTHPESSAPELTRMLNKQAQRLPCPGDYDLNGTGAQDAFCTGYQPYNSFYGHGMVDTLAAVSN